MGTSRRLGWCPATLFLVRLQKWPFLGGSRTLWRGPRVSVGAENTKNIKNFDKQIEALPLMPHNLIYIKKYLNTFPSLLASIQFVKTRSHRLIGANATGTCFDKFYSHQKRWERVLATGTCFDKFKLVKMRRERIYKNVFFGPLKACYGHKGVCTRWGRSQGFRKYP